MTTDSSERRVSVEVGECEWRHFVAFFLFAYFVPVFRFFRVSRVPVRRISYAHFTRASERLQVIRGAKRLVTGSLLRVIGRVRVVGGLLCEAKVREVIQVR